MEVSVSYSNNIAGNESHFQKSKDFPRFSTDQVTKLHNKHASRVESKIQTSS